MSRVLHSSPSVHPELPSTSLRSHLAPALTTIRDNFRDFHGEEIAEAEAVDRAKAMCGCDRCRPATFDDAYSVPLKRWESDLAHFLFDRRYTAEAVRDILAHAREWGSVECSTTLDEEDKADAEAILPVAAAGSWSNPAYSGHWVLNI